MIRFSNYRMGNNNLGLKYNLLKHTAYPFLLNSISVIDYIERHLTNPGLQH